MDNIDKINEFNDIGKKIVSLYDEFVSLLFTKNNGKIKVDDICFVLDQIKKEVNKEYVCYKDISLDEIDDFIKKVSETEDRDLTYSDIRVKNKLAILYDKLLGNIVLNNGIISTLSGDYGFSLIDLVTSKIMIDIYKLMDMKLNSLLVHDDKSKEYKNRLIELNIQYIIHRLSLNELSERMGIEYCYDIKNMPVISFDYIENSIYESYGVTIDLKNKVNSKIFKFLAGKINEFNSVSIYMDSYESIYDNLLYVSIFEVLISYLTKSQLEFILVYFNRISSNNKIISANIKRLIRSKINEL